MTKDDGQQQEAVKILIKEAPKYESLQLRCPYDRKKLEYRETKILRSPQGRLYCFPVYYCSHCGSLFSYTDYYHNLQLVKVNGAEYINFRSDYNKWLKKKTGKDKKPALSKKEKSEPEPSHFRKFYSSDDIQLYEKEHPEQVRNDKPYVASAVKYADVMVKSHRFKCKHSDHKIEHAMVEVPIINKDGNIITRKINAGYCPRCHTFFITEESYNQLKSTGTIACRVKEEDAYYHPYTSRINNLADQSILMEYGYSVSSSKDLSDKERHKILSILMDNKILSWNEIVDYLDFFIRQRQKQKKDFSDAIRKWNYDIAYVYKYGNRRSKNVVAKSIKHKKYHKI